MESKKDLIIYTALTLFSERGYEGVSMRDIAGEVGIKASSLYNYFRSKEEIFNNIISEMSKRYEETVTGFNIPHGDIDRVTAEYMRTTEETLLNITAGIFLYYLKDDFASKFRRMLTMEQFRNTQAGETFLNFFIDGVLNFQTVLFDNMIKQGAFTENDPYVMALHFYSPVFLLLLKYDRLPGKEREALDILKKHIKKFSALYIKNNVKY